MNKQWLLVLMLAAGLNACIKSKINDTSAAAKSTASNSDFELPAISAGIRNQYWNQGKAELNTYDVTQERYGEIREAEAMILFVSEDLSAQKQVKLDDPMAAGADRVPVLKMNAVRRFHTGIYDYSLMQSVFTPMDGSATLKTSTTVQDWCGQVFAQMNLEKDAYRYRSFSYFESEGDQDIRLPKALLEDALMLRLRLQPDQLPMGEVQVIPSTLFARLRHKPLEAQPAELSIQKKTNESELVLQYKGMNRRLSIRFETSYPHRILGWEESMDDKLSSKGVLKASRMSAYWSEHDNKHEPLRDSLKLRF